MIVHTPLAEAVRLAPTFDAEQLVQELAEVTSHRWQPQRIHASGGGLGPAAPIDWRVLPLRSPGGDADRTDPGGPGPADYAPTIWLDRLPYLRDVLATIPAPLNAVRLMALGPGATSQPHRDPKYALFRGLVRLHIPVVTNPDAILLLDGVEHHWEPGEFWYGDFSREHSVRNSGHLVRVHAVIDALLTRELAQWFPTDWQIAMDRGEVLFNRTALNEAQPADTIPHRLLLPSGFTDFSQDQPLDGVLELATVDVHSDGVKLGAAGGRDFALVPVGPAEYRFAGWSEQRTLQLAPAHAIVCARHGHTMAQRQIALAD